MQRTGGKIDSLNDEQKSIAEMVAEGMTNIEIAEELGYSERSIVRKIKKIFIIFKISRRYELIREILRLS